MQLYIVRVFVLKKEIPGRNFMKCFVIGHRDGQTMMVRQVDCIEAYQWSASESRWVKVGNVVGGSNDSQTTSGRGKTHFEGKVQYSCCILFASTSGFSNLLTK